jgi:hypothetical protein
MKSIKLKIPTLETSQLSKYHFLRETHFDNVAEPKIGEIIRYVSEWTDTPYEVVATITREGVYSAFNTIVKMLADYKPRPPKMRVNNLTLRIDYHKMSAGWWNHLDAIDMDTEPEQLLALIYIEDGMNYAEIDKNKNIINPTSERVEQLKEAFNLREFMDVMAFFLNVSLIAAELSESKQEEGKVKKKMTVQDGSLRKV